MKEEKSCKPGMTIKLDGCDVEIHGTQIEQKACAAHIMLALFYASLSNNNLKRFHDQCRRESDEIMEQLRQLDI